MRTQLEDKRLPLPAIALLPHRPPMLFVDRLLERCGDKAEGAAVLPDKGICLHQDILLTEYFIEVIAQTIAMANGYDALCAGKEVNDGMLVGVDSFVFENTVPPGGSLHIVIEKTFEFGAVRIIHGEIFHGSILLAQGDIKVWEALG